MIVKLLEAFNINPEVIVGTAQQIAAQVQQIHTMLQTLDTRSQTQTQALISLMRQMQDQREQMTRLEMLIQGTKAEDVALAAAVTEEILNERIAGKLTAADRLAFPPMPDMSEIMAARTPNGGSND